MPPLEERMRQFTVVIKFAMQTGQMRRGGCRRVGEPNLMHIAKEEFGLDNAEYTACYYRARQLLERCRKSLSSDDLMHGHFKVAA